MFFIRLIFSFLIFFYDPRFFFCCCNSASVGRDAEFCAFFCPIFTLQYFTVQYCLSLLYTQYPFDSRLYFDYISLRLPFITVLFVAQLRFFFFCPPFVNFAIFLFEPLLLKLEEKNLQQSCDCQFFRHRAPAEMRSRTKLGHMAYLAYKNLPHRLQLTKISIF